MASQIRISPDQMRERANSYQTESGNVSEMIGRLDSLLQSLFRRMGRIGKRGLQRTL